MRVLRGSRRAAASGSLIVGRLHARLNGATRRRRCEAATRTQAWWRGERARRAERPLRRDMGQRAQLFVAATALQSFFRCSVQAPLLLEKKAREMFHLVPFPGLAGVHFVHDARRGTSGWDVPPLLSRHYVELHVAQGRMYSDPAYVLSIAPPLADV